MPVALYTFGQFLRASDDPANDGFHARNDANLAAVDRASGLIGRSGYDGDPGPESWGPQVYPRFFDTGLGDDWTPSTLSLWQDIESIWAYTYSGLHAEALTHSRAWFRKGDWPPLVMWMSESRPNWAEAVRRHEHLFDHGPSPYAFGFRTPFDALGLPYAIDRDRVRAIAVQNAGRSARS